MECMGEKKNIFPYFNKANTFLSTGKLKKIQEMAKKDRIRRKNPIKDLEQIAKVNNKRAKNKYIKNLLIRNTDRYPPIVIFSALDSKPLID